MKRAIYLGLIGSISGLFTFYVLSNKAIESNHIEVSGDINMMMFIFPGLVFGILFSIADYLYVRKDIIAHFFSIFVSTFAYFVAVNVFFIIIYYTREENFFLLFCISGFVGSAILSLFLKMKYHILWDSALLIIFVGTVASYIGQNPDNYYYVYLIWQPAVAIAIGYALDEAEKRSSAGL